MTIDANTDKQTPLRAGYNSLVPDLDKWRQFDRDWLISRQRLQQTHLQSSAHHNGLLSHWRAMMQKLLLKPVRVK